MSDDDNVNHFDDSVITVQKNTCQNNFQRKILLENFIIKLLKCREEAETIGASSSLITTWVLVKRNGSILDKAMQFCFILRQCKMKSQFIKQ